MSTIEAGRNFMALYGERLVRNGYRLIPVWPGFKRPGAWDGKRWHNIEGWEKHCDVPTTADQVAIWSAWPECSVGVCGGIVAAVDIDVLADPDLAARLEALAREHLGDTHAVRYGNKPKRVLVYRTAEPFPGISLMPLQVLCRGQQFVGYGVHPETGREYEWSGTPLHEIPISELPTITQSQAAAWLDEAYKLVPPHLIPAKKLQSALEAVTSAHIASDPAGTYEAIKDALNYIRNDNLPCDEWITIGTAIKAAIGEAGKDLWCAWSRTSNKSGQSGKLDTPETRWEGLKPRALRDGNGVGAGTVYHKAIEGGWIPDPEIELHPDNLGQEGPHPAAALIAKFQPKPEPVQTDPLPDIMDVEGVLREFVDWNVASAVSPQPFLALGAAICLVGALGARRYVGPTGLRSNIYAIAVADSGAGKDHPRQGIKTALADSNLGLFIGDSFASSSGIATALETFPARIYTMDEFGKELAKWTGARNNQYVAEIWTRLTQLYTEKLFLGPDRADIKAHPRIIVHHPGLCIYGSTVPGPLWDALQHGSLKDGSIARWLIFQSPNDYPPRNQNPASCDVPETLIAGLRAITTGATGHDYGNLPNEPAAKVPLYRVPVEPDAATLFSALLEDQDAILRSAEPGSHTRAIVARRVEMIHKLALISSISRRSARPVLTLRDVQWATTLAKHSQATLLRDAERFVASNEVEARANRVLDLLRRLGPIDGSTLCRKTRDLTPRDRQAVMANLLADGSVITTKETVGRTTKTTYRLA